MRMQKNMPKKISVNDEQRDDISVWKIDGDSCFSDCPDVLEITEVN